MVGGGELGSWEGLLEVKGGKQSRLGGVCRYLKILHRKANCEICKDWFCSPHL